MSAALLACCALVLLASAWSHVRDPRALIAGLGAHGLVPVRLRTPMARVLTATELALGVAGLAAALTGLLVVAVVAAAACTLLFLAMSGYLLAARRSAPAGVPCACGLGDAPLGPWVTARALILAGLAAVVAGSAAVALASADAGAWGLAGRPVDEAVVLVCAALALAIAVALLPVARRDPEGLVLAAGGAR